MNVDQAKLVSIDPVVTEEHVDPLPKLIMIVRSCVETWWGGRGRGRKGTWKVIIENYLLGEH